MDDKYFREQAARVRQIASLADPFTKKRLLALAERYDAAKPSPRMMPRPSSKDSDQHVESAISDLDKILDIAEE
jgi:hypothetical protein